MTGQPTSRGTGTTGGRHWNAAYENGRGSWHEDIPHRSLELITSQSLGEADPIIDVGGGTAALVDGLLDRGFRDVTVLDVSDRALAVACERLSERGEHVHWVVADVLTWTPPRVFALWHDRAVFHFLVTKAQRDRYRHQVSRAVRPHGHLVVATFAPDGPGKCSQLPVARYSAESLTDEFADDFVLVRDERAHHTTPSGGSQPFTWVVLQRRDAPASAFTGQDHEMILGETDPTL